MFDRISRGWDIVTQSWSVVRQDRELLLFPVLSGLACLLVAATFLLPLFLLTDVPRMLEQNEQPWRQPLGYAVLFVYYFVNYFVIVFFNTALVSCAIIRFRGGDPTVMDGLRAAGARLPQILAWALVAATVGLILRIIEDRLKFVGQIIVGLVGLAWSIVTYLVVPVLAVEGVGPFTAVKRSAQLLRQTWGESLTGHFSIGLVSFLLTLPAILLVVVGVAAAASLNALWLGVAIVVLAVVYLVGVSIVTSALQPVFLAGVYLFAADRQVPAGFSEDLLRTAFRAKR